MDQFLIGAIFSFLVVIAVDRYRVKTPRLKKQESEAVKEVPFDSFKQQAIGRATRHGGYEVIRNVYTPSAYIRAGEQLIVQTKSLAKSSLSSEFEKYSELIGAIVELNCDYTSPRPTSPLPLGEREYLRMNDRLLVQSVERINDQWFFAYYDVENQKHLVPMYCVRNVYYCSYRCTATGTRHWVKYERMWCLPGRVVKCKGNWLVKGKWGKANFEESFKIIQRTYLTGECSPDKPCRCYPALLLNNGAHIPIWRARALDHDCQGAWAYPKLIQTEEELT